MSGNPVKLFIFDLDGTALGGHTPYEQFPRPFARLLTGLSQRGIRWATNTTWEVNNQFRLIQRSGLRGSGGLLAGSTGRALATVRNGRLVIDRRHERMVLARDRRFRRATFPAVRAVLLKLLKQGLVERLCLNELNQNLIRFTCRKGCAERAWRAVAPLVESGMFYPWSPNRPAEGLLLPAFMNKGEVVRLLQRRTGARPEETIVAGNEVNDLPMLDPRQARWLICPANSSPAVKRAVRKAGGIVAKASFSWGLVEAVRHIVGDEP